MKKKYIIPIVIMCIVITGMAIAIRFMSPQTSGDHSIRFNLIQNNLTVAVFKQSETHSDKSTKITDISSTKTLALADGNYYYIATGEHVAPASITFAVSGNATIQVDPSFTNEYLATLVPGEADTAGAAIRSTYPKVNDGYVIDRGQLFQQGQWYATTIFDKRSTNRNPYDTYRIVLLKENGIWQAMTKPEINLSTADYPNIPREILSGANKLDQFSEQDTSAGSFD